MPFHPRVDHIPNLLRDQGCNVAGNHWLQCTRWEASKDCGAMDNELGATRPSAGRRDAGSALAVLYNVTLPRISPNHDMHRRAINLSSLLRRFEAVAPSTVLSMYPHLVYNCGQKVLVHPPLEGRGEGARSYHSRLGFFPRGFNADNNHVHHSYIIPSNIGGVIDVFFSLVRFLDFRGVLAPPRFSHA